MSATAAARPTLAPSVATTLDVLAAEIEVAGARCLTLDRVIGEMMGCLPEADRARMLHGLHGVDMLVQHLSCLSAFARDLSQAAPAGVTLPAQAAIGGITLGALAERMAAGLGGPAPARAANADGDVDLF
jgi:hypothetical protein